MLMELWKDIPGFEGLYKANVYGQIKSLYTNKILKSNLCNNGYWGLTLCKNKIKKRYNVHRLVALTFIDNPNNYPIVNHIDGNKQNNNVNNLEWCTQKHNVKESFKLGLSKSPNINKNGKLNHKSKLIAQIDKKTNKIINHYYGAYEVERKTGICASYVWRCCHGKLKSAKGYKWKYIESENV